MKRKEQDSLFTLCTSVLSYYCMPYKPPTQISVKKVLKHKTWC